MDIFEQQDFFFSVSHSGRYSFNEIFDKLG
jgi:hypothetical protein